MQQNAETMRGGGRKKLKQGALQGGLDLQPGHSISRVVSLRGSNIIEVEDAESVKTLCLLPAKFNKTLWIRKGSFVEVQEGEREKALESGNKVTGIICQVLFEEQIRALRRSSTWPAAFNDQVVQWSALQKEGSHFKNEMKGTFENGVSDGTSSGDEGLPPLETNQNRRAVDNDLYESSSDEDDVIDDEPT